MHLDLDKNDIKKGDQILVEKWGRWLVVVQVLKDGYLLVHHVGDSRPLVINRDMLDASWRP